MASLHGKSAEHINRVMKIYLPETAGNNYADYPMTGDRWLRSNEKTPKGEPCFISTENKMPPTGPKNGYVWGPGPNTFGYYHLTTKAAHVSLYNRIVAGKVNTGVGNDGCCDCFGTPDPATQMPKIKADDRDTLRLLFHARTAATKANDAQAFKDQHADAKGTAQAFYHYDQNAQLVHMVGAAAMRRS